VRRETAAPPGVGPNRHFRDPWFALQDTGFRRAPVQTQGFENGWVAGAPRTMRRCCARTWSPLRVGITAAPRIQRVTKTFRMQRATKTSRMQRVTKTFRMQRVTTASRMPAATSKHLAEEVEGRSPPMLLRYCLPWGIRIIHLRGIQEIPPTLCRTKLGEGCTSHHAPMLCENLVRVEGVRSRV